MIDSLILPFKHWSEKGSVYIISDTHFNDHDCKIMDTNWPEPDELVANINKVVHKQDSLIILGDIGDCSYVKKLRAGHKILLLGNIAYFSRIFSILVRVLVQANIMVFDE